MSSERPARVGAFFDVDKTIISENSASFGHPVEINPEPLLYRRALQRHWPMRFFDKPE